MAQKYLSSILVGIIILLGISLPACGQPEKPPPAEENQGLELVVTTTFIGDVVKQVAGEIPHITVLLEPGQNPHSFQPTPQDMVMISRADVIFVNGLDLEEFLDDLLDGSGTQAELIVVSEGIHLLGLPDQDGEEEDDHENEEDHDHGV